MRFTHHDEGTSESVWWAAPQWDDVPILDLPGIAKRFARVLVAIAHPDDETIGVGGLLADLAEIGLPITVLLATSGERSHSGLGKSGRDRLGTQRLVEGQQAINTLAPGTQLIHLGLPDARLSQHEESLRQAIVEHADENTLIVAPWTDDGHNDHDTVGQAAGQARDTTGSAVVHFPIWLWQWSSPETLPWQSMVAAEISRKGNWRKRSALEQYRSQSTPMAKGWGEPAAPILGPTLLSRARRLIETLIDPDGCLPRLGYIDQAQRSAARTSTLDHMYDGGSDPWGNTVSFYEDRRRALILGALGRRTYGRVLELGCADGYLTAALTQRADEVVAIDTSKPAVAAARLAAPTAIVKESTMPDGIPSGRFDLVILSEVGYFLHPTELVATLRRAREALLPGGELLLCHWQHPTKAVPLDGVLVHEQARSVLGENTRAQYVDEDLCIEVWGDSPSAARSEGRA